MFARWTLPASLVAAGLLLSACGGGSSTNVATVVPNHVSGVKGCKAVPAPAPKSAQEGLPKQTVKPGQKLTATVATSCGDFSIDLDTQDSPKTVNTFVDLAKRGIFDDTDFHRVVPDFVIQGGLANLTGPGGRGFTTVEPPPQNTSYRRGIVAMAKGNSDPIGAGSGEFFVVTAPADAGLPPQYAVLGKVASGMSTVERIASLADPALGDAGGEPIQPVVIDSVTVH
jgi:cyclophilin family peptidyl-prolyl cis-trans isomerase